MTNLIKLTDDLDNALVRLRALELATDGGPVNDREAWNAVLFLIGESLDAVARIRDDIDSQRLKSAA